MYCFEDKTSQRGVKRDLILLPFFLQYSPSLVFGVITRQGVTISSPMMQASVPTTFLLSYRIEQRWALPGSYPDKVWISPPRGSDLYSGTVSTYSVPTLWPSCTVLCKQFR